MDIAYVSIGKKFLQPKGPLLNSFATSLKDLLCLFPSLAYLGIHEETNILRSLPIEWEQTRSGMAMGPLLTDPKGKEEVVYLRSVSYKH